MWSCALSTAEDGSDDENDVDDVERAAVERAARELRGKLLEEIVRGARKRGEGEAKAKAKYEDVLDDERVDGFGEAVLKLHDGDAAGDDDEAAIARMRAAASFVLGFCAEILQPANCESAAMMPPLGTHVIRRKKFDDEKSVYFQEQCSYDYDETRTADHFMDYGVQKVHASAKVQIVPRVSMSGSIITVNLERPKPLNVSESFSIREGCFVEFRGCSGHPDYLSKRVETSAADDGEIFEFTLPSIQISGLARGYPIAELVGEVMISSKASGLKTSLKFREFDVETSPSFRNIVSGSIVRSSDDVEVKRLLLGTWDTRVLLGNIFSRENCAPDEALFTAHDFGLPPLTTATGVRSLLSSLQKPGSMSNRRLWQTIVEALRFAPLREPENSVMSEALSLPSMATIEMRDEDKSMGYELALMVADSPLPDAEPPLPRYWFPRTKKSGKQLKKECE